MKKNVRLKAVETAATNKDFYNLFRPIAPSVDLIGKIAQVISGLTEALTVWHISQSELSDANKIVATTVSIIAMILVVSILELGGRNFLQVLTRGLVWKRLNNLWSKILFTIVSFITIGIMVLSFRLSTNGIRHAFTNSLAVPIEVSIGDLQNIHDKNLAAIISQFNDERATLKENHHQLLAASTAQYNSKVQATLLKVDHYNERVHNGAKWAKSHAEKYQTQIAKLETQKATAITAANQQLNKRLEKWQIRKNKAIKKLDTQLATQVDERKSIRNAQHQAKQKKASFWGNLFSFLVGFSVILAFICIVTVEVFRRGSGIKVEYEEQEKNTSLIELFWKGLTTRWDGFFRKRIEGFAKASPTTQRSIGFNTAAFPTNDLQNDLPYSERK